MVGLVSITLISIISIIIVVYWWMVHVVLHWMLCYRLLDLRCDNRQHSTIWNNGSVVNITRYLCCFLVVNAGIETIPVRRESLCGELVGLLVGTWYKCMYHSSFSCNWMMRT